MQPTSRDSYFKAILSIIGVALEFVPKDDIPALQKDPEQQNICFENTIFIGAPFFWSTIRLMTNLIAWFLFVTNSELHPEWQNR